MKLIRELVILVGGVVLCASFSAQAQEVKPSSPVEIKCHVELVGGGDIIHFAQLSNQQYKSVKKLLVGKEISTALSRAKKVIYKVNECVGLHDKFNSAAAKSRDILTAR